MKNNETRENLGSNLLVGHKNLMLSDYMNDFKSRSIAVPVSVTSSLFVLDFEVVLKEIFKGQKDISEDKLRTLLSLLVKSYDKINDKDLVSALKEMGFVPAKGGRVDLNVDPIEKVVEDLKQRVGRSVSESGLTGLMVSSFFLESEASTNFNEFKEISFANVAAVVSKAQNFYSRFIQKEKGDVLGMELHSIVSGNAIMSATRTLMRAFYNSTGSYVSCRESYVIDTIFQDVYGSPLITKQPIIEGRFYRITGVDIPDIGFADAVSAYIWSINMSMGMASSISSESKLSISDIVKELVTGIGVVMPFVPSEVGPVDAQAIEQHYSRIFLLHLIRRITTDQTGEYYSRISQMVKANRFFKIEEYEQPFEEGLKVLSICYEAFRDTAFYYRDMFHRKDVFFKDYESLHPQKRDKLIEFVDNLTAKLQNTNMSLEHPAYYKLPTHVITPMTSPFAATPSIPDWFVTREQRDSLPRYILGDKAEATLSVGSTGLLFGSNWWDIQDKLLNTKIPFPLIRSSKKINPIYFFTTPSDLGPLGGDAVKNMLSFFPLSKINDIKKTEVQIADIILQSGQLMYVKDVYELSHILQIPMEIAEKMYAKLSSSDEWWLDLSTVTDTVYFMDPKFSPVYEQISRDEPGRYIRPFLAHYPALITYHNQAYSFMESSKDIPELKPLGGTLIKDAADGGKKVKKSQIQNADDNAPDTMGADAVVPGDVDPIVE